MGGGIEFIVKSIATGAATRTVSFAGSYQSLIVRAEFNVEWPCRIIGFATSPGDAYVSTSETVTYVQTHCELVPTAAPTITRVPTVTFQPTPFPTNGPTPRPTVPLCGSELVAVGYSECPYDPNIATCDVVACGELCEGDGECGTDINLDNCNYGYDIYRKLCGTPAPTISPAPTLAPTFEPTPRPTTVCFSDDFSSIDSDWVSVEGDWSWSGGMVDNTNQDTGEGDVLYRDADFDDGYLEGISQFI